MSTILSASTHSKRKKVLTLELLSYFHQTHNWSMPLEVPKEISFYCKLLELFLRTYQFASRADSKESKERELTVLTSTHLSSLKLI